MSHIYINPFSDEGSDEFLQTVREFFTLRYARYLRPEVARVVRYVGVFNNIPTVGFKKNADVHLKWLLQIIFTDIFRLFGYHDADWEEEVDGISG